MAAAMRPSVLSLVYACVRRTVGDGQCVALANEWLERYLHGARVWRNAVDWIGYAIPGMAWVPNGPVNAPLAGDIVVWHPYVQLGIGQYGHIAVCVVADANVLVTFDQNWPAHDSCAIVCHTYGGVSGWHSG